MILPSGSILQGGRYQIERELGHGGFGFTYLATQKGLNRKVAIKEFFVKDFCNRDENTSYVTVGTNSKKALVEKLKNKFINEAKSIRKLHHNGIVKVSDVFEENGTAYYVMDYIEGRSLSQLIDNKGRLTETETMRYIRKISETLKYVHSKNMLHLDIKPGNIMIDEDDNPILIDFCTSKQYD
jgi:serine/threonine protein kinase